MKRCNQKNSIDDQEQEPAKKKSLIEESDSSDETGDSMSCRRKRRIVFLDCCSIINDLCANGRNRIKMLVTFFNFFWTRGHRVYYILPQHDSFLLSCCTGGYHLDVSQLLFTPSVTIAYNKVGLSVSQLFHMAEANEAVIISNDEFKAPRHLRASEYEVIEKVRSTRVVPFNWVNNEIWLPLLPFGPNGLPIHDVLNID